jgi:hypothetical protein
MEEVLSKGTTAMLTHACVKYEQIPNIPTSLILNDFAKSLMNESFPQQVTFTKSAGESRNVNAKE